MIQEIIENDFITLSNGVEVQVRKINSPTELLIAANTLSANVISLYLFIPANSITISNLQLNVTAPVAANIRILVYYRLSFCRLRYNLALGRIFLLSQVLLLMLPY